MFCKLSISQFEDRDVFNIDSGTSFFYLSKFYGGINCRGIYSARVCLKNIMGCSHFLQRLTPNGYCYPVDYLVSGSLTLGGFVDKVASARD